MKRLVGLDLSCEPEPEPEDAPEAEEPRGEARTSVVRPEPRSPFREQVAPVLLAPETPGLANDHDAQWSSAATPDESPPRGLRPISHRLA
jgi:hypothetical protein